MDDIDMNELEDGFEDKFNNEITKSKKRIRKTFEILAKLLIVAFMIFETIMNIIRLFKDFQISNNIIYFQFSSVFVGVSILIWIMYNNQKKIMKKFDVEEE